MENRLDADRRRRRASYARAKEARRRSDSALDTCRKELFFKVCDTVGAMGYGCRSTQTRLLISRGKERILVIDTSYKPVLRWVGEITESLAEMIDAVLVECPFPKR